MPNHVHGIIILKHSISPVGATPCGCPVEGQARGPAPTISLSDVVHRFKSLTTTRYRQGVKNYGLPLFHGQLWQRNYYEHIIRLWGCLKNVLKMQFSVFLASEVLFMSTSS